MWLRTIFRRPSSGRSSAPATALDERLLRRLERLVLEIQRDLRGGLFGAHPSRRQLPAPTFSDHRPYTAGDDLRYVDWNAYARLGDLQLKLGEAEQEVRVYLLVDCSASMDWGDGDSNKLHYARLLAAVIGYIALTSGDRLEIIPFSDRQKTHWGPAVGRQRASSLLQYLQAIRSGGAVTASALLDQLTRRARGGLVVILSDLWHNAELEAALARFHPPRWQILLLHLLHPEELEPDLQGDVELEDSESGARLLLQVDGGGLNQYAAAVDAWCDDLATMCASRNIAYSLVRTDMPLEQATIPYLRRRGVIR